MCESNMNFKTMMRLAQTTCAFVCLLIPAHAFRDAPSLRDTLRLHDVVEPLSEKERTFELVEPTNIPGHPELTFYLRMPEGWTGAEPTRDFFGRPAYSVRGVLALCTHRSEAEEVRGNVAKGGRFRHFIDFADKHNLAVITWTNFRGYRIWQSADEMDRDEQRAIDREFTQRAREWDSAMRRLTRLHNLPRENILLYGISGGGQMAHRIALRRPQWFSAIHIHVNSSYDAPTREAADLLWLVTTGEREYGYPAGERFYQEALEMNYHIIFKAGENLGHSDSPGIQRLSLAFFEYMVNFLPDPRDAEWRAPPVDKFYLMRYPTYIGDYRNHDAFPSAVADRYLTGTHIVSLPTEPIARAWGTVVEVGE